MCIIKYTRLYHMKLGYWGEKQGCPLCKAPLRTSKYYYPLCTCHTLITCQNVASVLDSSFVWFFYFFLLLFHLAFFTVSLQELYVLLGWLNPVNIDNFWLISLIVDVFCRCWNCCKNSQNQDGLQSTSQISCVTQELYLTWTLMSTSRY